MPSVKFSPALTEKMEHLEEVEPLQGSGVIGVGWASSGGESAALLNDKYLAADGIENVIRVLEELEDERIRELEFVELNACAGGCVGGVACVETHMWLRHVSSGSGGICRFLRITSRGKKCRFSGGKRVWNSHLS